MKSLLLLTLLSSTLSFANCENEELKIEINITETTFDESYGSEQAQFSDGDNIIVLEKSTNTEFVFKKGTLFNDGAGNFSVEASDFIASDVYVDHDHETWHTDGLNGGFTSPTKDYDLSSLKCNFDDLFSIN
jgi:hypothetical protein